MNVNFLLKPWIYKNLPNINILGLEENSKKIKYMYLFFSLIGYHNDGRKFIIESIKNGASCVLIDTNLVNNHNDIIFFNKTLLIFFYNLKKYVSYISGRFYNDPSKNINFIGITGTNGKTTVSNLIFQWIKLLNNKSAIMGTLGNGFLINKIKKSNNTTLSALEIQKKIHYYKSIGIKNIISEISSHGIYQNRIKSIYFKLGIITNITHDHLDFHKNFYNYKKCKLSFLTNHKISNSIINTNDIICKKNFYLFKNASSVSIKKKNIIFNSNGWIYIENIFFSKKKTLVYFRSNFGRNKLLVNFIGNFNITNLLLAFISMLKLGYSLIDLIKTSNLLKLPIGRMEIKNIKKYNKKIIIDYAHSPDSMKKTLQNIKNIYHKNIWTVFGCSGNKDKKKRKIMGNISSKYSYKTIITNDNPKNENQYKIVNNIIENIYKKNNFYIKLNRKKAIHYAINNSQKDSIIIIFGKGHEDYQIIKNKKINYSDIHFINKIIKISDKI
ncbi:UDP-N-acetylmuramoyl-L-alanyl-D-glutamate--2 6-diaminopimelate ligase [endosymbiont of Euscepes postfasciatus]|uniref:UDP-N-acetylmuramoyl-L-alanyl-D-glutamate--2, 6-diaminopimelate ligase n=1 Tax=endosymbiont of Euscepes postfasciatus TaxID=650377 RepID=UPI000DC7408A|nr:UDP-N-acetylmuramoyl-L-alanyl-D-glutamate--2,6-diaminopimelate ligase [endosymbiont of Euscepes postfasciatus]BBA84552.1 UDP-N-acetylmuramoyl-L-alanyl-D-glutamate--2 6-diaminopimelate ligase [endosymbiont of Euscepes postfasciatus]